MYNLALLGKGISHSGSPALYAEILGGSSHMYDLLDFSTSEEIPPLKVLLKNRLGLNITSPYKLHFIDSVKLIGRAKDLRSINCIKNNHGAFYGTNTDYIATIQILKQYISSGAKMFLILGDGVMSQMCQRALGDLKQAFQVYSRKKDPLFSNLDFSKKEVEKDSVIINCCGRSYQYIGKLASSHRFWDLNYNFPEHFDLACEYPSQYKDGRELLRLQALEAVKFWGIEHP